jgi:hypothetical protein
MADEVRHDRRARSTLWQTFVIAGDLRQDRRDLGIQEEISILDEKAPDSTKIDGWKKIVKVNIENISALMMLSGICDNRTISLESVR